MSRRVPRGSDAAAPEPGEGPTDVPELAQYAAAEHFTLQAARVATTTEAVGRATVFLGSVSGVVLALAFIGQVSNLDQPFPLFALVLLPPLLFAGLVTFVRVLESAIEYMVYERGMNRIRRLFVERAPELRDYLILSTHDDTIGTLSNTGAGPSFRQMFLTTAGLVAVVDSVIAASLAAVIAGTVVRASAVTTLVAGALAFVIILACHQIYQYVTWRRYERRIPVRFPSPPDTDEVAI